MKTIGLFLAAAIRSEIREVPPTLLSSMRLFFSGVHRPLAMLSPAKWTTASAPEKSKPSPGVRGIATTASPSRSNSVRRAVPINPVDPLKSSFMHLSRSARNASLHTKYDNQNMESTTQENGKIGGKKQRAQAKLNDAPVTPETSRFNEGDRCVQHVIDQKVASCNYPSNK